MDPWFMCLTIHCCTTKDLSLKRGRTNERTCEVVTDNEDEGKGKKRERGRDYNSLGLFTKKGNRSARLLNIETSTVRTNVELKSPCLMVTFYVLNFHLI